MNKVMIREITTKKGQTIRFSERVTLKFDVKSNSGEQVLRFVSMSTADGRRAIVPVYRLKHYLGMSVPTVKTLEKWSESGICKSVFGKKVEPDGTDPEGAPSWLLALGLI